MNVYLKSIFALITISIFLSSNVLQAQNCGSIDSIEIISYSADSSFISPTGVVLKVYNNSDIENKVKLNGNDNLTEELEKVLLDVLGEEKFRSELFSSFEVNGVVGKDNELHNLYFTNEIFWFFTIEDDNQTMFGSLEEVSDEEVKQMKSMFGYIEKEELILIKNHLRGQTWRAASCDGSEVDCQFVLSFNEPNFEQILKDRK